MFPSGNSVNLLLVAHFGDPGRLLIRILNTLVYGIKHTNPPFKINPITMVQISSCHKTNPFLNKNWLRISHIILTIHILPKQYQEIMYSNISL